MSGKAILILLLIAASLGGVLLYTDKTPPVVLDYVHVGSAQPRSSYSPLLYRTAARTLFV